MVVGLVWGGGGREDRNDEAGGQVAGPPARDGWERLDKAGT